MHKPYTYPTCKPYTAASQVLCKTIHKTLIYNLMSKFEKPFPSGRGWGRLPLQKSNNFERFFGDLTLTFLTFGNTFRLPILPSRRAVLLCLPLIFLCLPLIFLCLPLIFPGCASKIPDFKGKVTKKGGEPRLLPYLSTNIILFIAKSKKC